MSMTVGTTMSFEYVLLCSLGNPKDIVSMASRVKSTEGGNKANRQKQEEEEVAEEEGIDPIEEEEEYTKGQFIDKKPRKGRKQKTKEKDIPIDSSGRKKRKVTKTRKEKDRKGRTGDSNQSLAMGQSYRTSSYCGLFLLGICIGG